MDLSRRLRALLAELEDGLLERGAPMRLALLAALAGEHTLLVGPPGTAKSELARRLHRAFRDARYFERLLTRFSVPEELFGPLSIRALEEDRYERHVAGFLPDAQIAFVDEVFKANSAILNALLTLLNEREFDNGAARIRCPLISVVGATNEIPADEIADAFFDRFLVRVPVASVGDASFAALLALSDDRGGLGVAARDALEVAELETIERHAREVAIPDDVVSVLAELRRRIASEGGYISDRRWVKIAGLLRTAAATEGRPAVSLWDLGVVHWCVAADAAGSTAAAEWIAARIAGVAGMTPPRLHAIVRAFESQLEIEREADDLDYDDNGRLRFGVAVEDGVVDAKGGAGAMRMSTTRRRRYGATHVAARIRQVDALIDRIDRYGAEIAGRRADLATYAAGSVWLDPMFARRAAEQLAAAGTTIAELRDRATNIRDGFHALPRLVPDPGATPAPIDHDAVGPA